MRRCEAGAPPPPHILLFFLEAIEECHTKVLDDASQLEVVRALEAGEMGAARNLFADKELETGKEEEPPGDWELGDRSAENRQV